jgi:hypothetical protein
MMLSPALLVLLEMCICLPAASHKEGSVGSTEGPTNVAYACGICASPASQRHASSSHSHPKVTLCMAMLVAGARWLCEAWGHVTFCMNACVSAWLVLRSNAGHAQGGYRSRASSSTVIFACLGPPSHEPDTLSTQSCLCMLGEGG